jgi:hypothetical protein
MVTHPADLAVASRKDRAVRALGLDAGVAVTAAGSSQTKRSGIVWVWELWEAMPFRFTNVPRFTAGAG